MPFDNTRVALLAVLCGLTAQSFSPFGGVQAGVVHRQPKATQANQFARHDIGKVADYDDAGLHHNQASFPYPWSRRGDAKQLNEVRHSQKSTIAISNAHGAKYLVNHPRQASTPQWITVPRNRTLSNSTASTSSSPDAMPGTVAIVSRNPDPHNDRVLASLLLVNQSDGTYVLDASDRNATEVFLTRVPSSEMNASASDTYPVKITVPVDGTPMPYCATYDQAPRKPEPLTAQQCMGDGVRSGHTSQIFIYNSSSGVVQPTYIQGQSVDVEDVGVPSASPPSSASPSGSMGAANAGVVSSSDSASPTPSANASSASWNRRDDGTYAAQNVTLMFVPKRIPANAAAAAVQEVSTSTVTSTQTVIVYSSAASLSASAVNAADSTPSPFVSSSGSPAMAGATGLSVEVVGNGLPQAPLAFSSVGMVAASRQSPPSPTPSNSPSPSIDAAAVAASSSGSGSAPTTPSPSAGIDAVASLSPSDNSTASMSSAPASSSARTIFERAKVAPVSTEPYFWRFKADGR